MKNKITIFYMFILCNKAYLYSSSFILLLSFYILYIIYTEQSYFHLILLELPHLSHLVNHKDKHALSLSVHIYYIYKALYIDLYSINNQINKNTLMKMIFHSCVFYYIFKLMITKK